MVYVLLWSYAAILPSQNTEEQEGILFGCLNMVIYCKEEYKFLLLESKMPRICEDEAVEQSRILHNNKLNDV
jgi:hypothetical protein